MPHARLLEAAQAAQRKMGAAGRPGGLSAARHHRPCRARGGRRRQAPAAPPVRPGGARRLGARPDADRHDLNEFANEIQTPGIEAITEQELRARASAAYGEQGRARGRGLSPRDAGGARPADIFSRISAAAQRHNAIVQATRKRALGAAPAFLYWFTWQTPILDGRPRAFHCAELPFVFDNTDRCAAMTGGSAEARDTGRTRSATRGSPSRGPANPNHAGLPKWPAFEPATPAR